MKAPTVTGTLVLEVEQMPWGVVIAAAGELDVGSVPALRKRLEEAVSGGARRLLLDFGELTFIDSVSLAAVVAAHRRMGEDGRVVIATEHPYVLLILEAGGLGSVIEVFPTRSDAEAALTG